MFHFRFRTAINVLGDSFGAAIVAHLSRDEIIKEDISGNRKKSSSQLEMGERSKGHEIDLAFSEEDGEMAPLAEEEKMPVSYTALAGDRTASRCVDM